MEMSSDSKDVKLRSQNKQPTCKYEKARRDRLNLFITELSTFLPEQNPTKSLSKIDVLEKIVQLIKQLLDEKEKLANKNCVDECLKEELKELKTTVSNLKARIVTLNKILKEAHLSVPLDLEVQHFDKNFTPHLRYSHRKRALTCQSTQTEQVDNESQGKSNQPHKEAHKKENEEESVGKLISFTKKLKPPLQEIQDNFSRQNEKAVRVGAVACHVVPPQILVVPLYPATRPAFTQLTFSNKRPISSYTHFKKIYTHQQEKLVKKARRKRQSRLRKKCSCQTVVLKKPDGTLKKIIKLCGYKSCKNKTKFRKIHEAAKQQLSEQAKAEKVKEISKVPAVDEHRVEMTRQEKNETEQPVPDSQQTMGVYSEQDLLQNLDTRDTGDTKLYESKETCSNNNTNKFEKENEYGPENTNYDFSNPTPSVSKKEKNTEDCYYPCTNYFSPMNSSSNYAVHTSGLNYESIKEDTKMRNQIHHSNMNSKSHNGSNTALEEKNPSNPHNNLILSVESNINQKDSHLTENINCNKNRNPDSLNLNNVNVVTHNIDDLNQKPSIETCVTPVLETYTSGNKLKQTKTPVEHVGSGSNARYVPSKSDGINGNNSMNNTSNDVSSQVNNVNGNNMSSNSALGSYSINSVIFSSKSCTNETIYQMPNCTSKHINSDMSYKGSNIMFHDQREKANQKIMETNNKTNNVSLSKQIVRKNLNFSFENLGSNVMSSEPSVEFGYNVSSDTGSIHPLLDSNYNTAEPHQLAFSCKNNTLFVGDTSYVESSEGKSSCYFESHPNALHFPYVSTNDKAALSSATKYCEENKRKVNLKQRQDIINNSSHDISQNIFEVNNKENSFDFLFGKQNSLNTPQKSKRKSDSCLMSDKAFLFEEMKFHSEFSNDLFSLPGQVGGQNLECVSPTAAFLLTFPVVSSKQTDLTDNIEPSNTITPIGNMESLSQDLPDLNFKSNIKGLFDPFYPSCLGTDKLNFDLNAMDHVREDHLLNKANFPSCSEVNNVVNNTPWSTNIISNDDSLKKKNSGEYINSLNSNKAKVKSSQSITGSGATNSKCAQTLFSYPGGSDTVNNPKNLVNWMTSAETQDEKKLTVKVNKSHEPLPPHGSSSIFYPSNKPAFTSSFSIASFSNTTSSSNFVAKSSNLTNQDIPVCSTFFFDGGNHTVPQSSSKNKTQMQPPMSFNSNETMPSYSQNKTRSQTHSSHTCKSNTINETSIIKSDPISPCENYAKQENTGQKNLSMDTTKSEFGTLPDNTFEMKTTTKSCDQFVYPNVHYYPSNPVSTTSSFLSVSQLVEPGKPEIKHTPSFAQSCTTKSNAVKNEIGIHVEFKETMSNDNKHNNYSTEALLSSPLKHDNDVSKVTSGSYPYKSVESKARLKRKRSNSKTISKINPVNFSSIYNVTTTSVSNILYNTASCDPYYIRSSSTVDHWNRNSLSKPIYSSSSYTSFDSTANNQNYFGSTNHENYVPLVSQNYSTPTTSSIDKLFQNHIPSFTCSSQSYVTSSGYTPLSQHSYNKTKQIVSCKPQSAINTKSSGPKIRSTSVGTQVITSSFPQLPTTQAKPVSSLLQSTSTTNIMSSSWNMAPSPSFASATKITVSSFMPIHTSSTALLSTNPNTSSLINFSTVPFTMSSTLNFDPETICSSFKHSFVSSSSSLPISRTCHPSSLAISTSTFSSASLLSSNPVPITPIICTSVTYSSYSAGSLIAPSLHSTGSERRIEGLYTPVASSGSHSYVSTSQSSAPKLTPKRTQNSSQYCIPLNTSITSSLSYSSPNTPSTSSISYSSLNTPITSSITYSLHNTTKTLPSLSCGSIPTPMTSSTLYSTINAPMVSSLPYYSINSPNSSASLSYPSHNTLMTSSNLSHASVNTPITSSVLSMNTSKSSSLLKSSLNTLKTSSSLSYSSINVTKTSSYSSINTPITSSSLSYSSIDAPKTLSSLSYSSLHNPIITSSISYASLNTPLITSSSQYSSPKTTINSSNPSQSSRFTPIISSCQSYASLNNSIVTSSSPSLKIPLTSSNLCQVSYKTPLPSISYASLNTPSTSSVASYASLSMPINSSSLSYTSLNTPITSSSLSYVSFNTPIITSSISYASFNDSINSSKLSYSPLNNSFASSSICYTPVRSQSVSYNPGNNPYSGMTLYPPVTSSVTDFNLSTIFPEINVKNQTHSRGPQLYAQHKNYQRSNKRKS